MASPILRVDGRTFRVSFGRVVELVTTEHVVEDVPALVAKHPEIDAWLAAHGLDLDGKAAG